MTTRLVKNVDYLYTLIFELYDKNVRYFSYED
jgi:hypothetical protein